MPKQKTAAFYIRKGISPKGLHVTMEKYNSESGSVSSILGTVKGTWVEPLPYYSERLIVQFMNGEEWPVRPFPGQVNVLERTYIQK
jgi:hypothetical protein